MIQSAYVTSLCIALGLLVTCHLDAQPANAQNKTTGEKKTEPQAPDKRHDRNRISEIRILTYNIHGGRGLDGKIDLNRIATVIKSASPNLVALQEVDVNTRRSGRVDQAEKLAELCDMKSVFGKAIDYQGGAYGNAVLSSQNIIASNTIEVSNVGAERRVAVGAAIQVGKKEIVTLISTHFDHQSQEARARSANELSAVVKRSTGVVIVAGDFNCALGSKELAPLVRVASSPSQQPVFTFPAAKPSKQIDFILLDRRANWKLQKIEAIDAKGASDHRSLLAVFTIERD